MAAFFCILNNMNKYAEIITGAIKSLAKIIIPDLITLGIYALTILAIIIIIKITLQEVEKKIQEKKEQ